MMEQLEDTEYNATGLTSGKLYYWTVIPCDGGSFGSCCDGIRTFKVNSAPKFAPLNEVRATSGSAFKLKIMVTDSDPEDARNLKYSLIRYPDGMTIDKDTGMIRWNPNDNQVGDRSTIVQVTDGIEASTLSFNVVVLQGKDVGLPMIPIFIGTIMIFLIIALFLIFFLRKKKDDDGDVDKSITDKSTEIIAEMERHKRAETELYGKSPEVVHSSVPLTADEAHAHDAANRPQTYEELYGVPSPKIDETLTTLQLKNEIGEMAEELESELKEIDH